MHDVQRGEVATFPPEEPEQVDQHDSDGYQHRVAYVPARIQLGLFGSEGTHDHTPAHHAEAAVGELLQVNSKQCRVQFHAPVIVPDEVTRQAVVLRTGPIAPLEIQEQAEDQALPGSPRNGPRRFRH